MLSQLKYLLRSKTYSPTLPRISLFSSLDFKEPLISACTQQNPGALNPGSTGELFLESTTKVSKPQTKDTLTIYAVDNEPRLTELYTLLLEATGYEVKTFNDRTIALIALKADRKKPNLLIMDYLGHSMTVERFIHSCLSIHPALRILMASGLSEKEIRFSDLKPDRFIRKPFTAEEFLEEVRAALAGENL